MPGRPRKNFMLRIDPALHEALEAWAQREFRSLNGQIEYVLKDAVRRQGKQLTDGEDKSPTVQND